VIGTGNGSIMRDVADLMRNGAFKAVIDSEFTLDESVKAIERQMSGRAKGKVVVKIA
jgi:NADPH:quinone reductase-like Zn-dependent oxidoreductase